MIEHEHELRIYLKVLGYKTAERTVSRKTVYFLTFNFKAISSTKIRVLTFRVKHFNDVENEKHMHLGSDLLEEKKKIKC